MLNWWQWLRGRGPGHMARVGVRAVDGWRLGVEGAGEVPDASELQCRADLDESAKFVVVSEEAKAELAKIPNVIGDYVCRLCRVKYDDCFGLASHKCPRIVHQEYRCSECDKVTSLPFPSLFSLPISSPTCHRLQVFSCPANLASHKRWHKPRPAAAAELNNNAGGPLNLSLQPPPSYETALNNPIPA